MNVMTILFDLDNTLYAADTGVFALVDRRIHQFLVERMRMTEKEARAFRAHAISAFGTTLRGLMFYYPYIDPIEFLDYCHDIPLEQYLGPHPELRRMLEALPQRKWIFTNSDIKHTRRVLKILGIDDLFEHFITIETTRFIPKPHWETYAEVVFQLGHPPSRAVFVDDLFPNLVTARRWGFQTIWVARRPAQSQPVDGILKIQSVLELPAALSSL